MGVFLHRLGLLSQLNAAIEAQAPTIIAEVENANTTPFSLNFPTHQVGDFLLLIHHTSNGTPAATKDGWISIAGQGRGGDHAVRIQYKFADGDNSVGTFSGLASITVIRGVDRYNPIDAVAVINAPPSGGSTNYPYSDITTNTNNALVCCVASSSKDASSGTQNPWRTFVHPNLTDAEEVVDRVHPWGAGGGLSLYVGTMATAGAVGTGGSIQHYVNETFRFSVIFALKPLVVADIPVDTGTNVFQPFVSNIITSFLTGVTELNHHPNYTVTPKAAIFIGSEVIIVGSFAKGLGANFGVATATDEFAVSTKEEEKDPAFEREIVAGYSDRVINCFNAQGDGGSSPVASASLDSFQARAIRLDWSVVDTARRRIQTIALLGGNIDVKAGKIALGATNVAITINVGFKPNALIFFSPSRTDTAGGLFDGSGLVDSMLHWGFASWDDTTVRQCSFARWSDQDANPADIRAGATENGVFTLTDPTDGYAEVSNFTSTGFDLTTKIFNPTANTQEVCYLAIGNVNAWAGALDTPLSTGNKAYASLGFLPKFGIVSLTNLTALDTESTSAGTPAHIGMTHGVNNSFCHTWSVEVASPGVNTESRSREFLLDIVSEDTDTELCQGDFVSWDAGGFTLDFTLLSSGEGWTTTARKMLGLYIG